jgi:hypothetical protein
VDDHRALDDGEHLLGDVVGEGPEPGPLTTNENYGVHQLEVVVVVADCLAVVVVVVDVLVVVVVVGAMNACTLSCPSGRDTKVPSGTKATMYISPFP